MAKPITKRVGVQSSDIVIGSEIHARGAQQTGPSKAARNAAALGQFLGTTGVQLSGEHEQREAEAGALAAQHGDVTEATLRAQEKSAAWVRGAEQIVGRARAIEDEQAMHEWYATEFDKNKDLPTLRGELNAWMKDRYEGTDPGVAGEVAPYLARGAASLMKQHGDSETLEGVAMVQNGLATSTAEWLARAPEDRTAEEWKSQRDEYTAMFPTREAGLMALASNMSQAAIASGDESDLKNNPMFEQMRTNPLTREVINAGISEAKKIRIATYIENTKVQRALVEQEAKQIILQGDTQASLAFIAEHSVSPGEGLPADFTEGEVDALINDIYNTSSAAVLTPLMVEKFNQGLVSSIPKKFRDPAFDAWFADAQNKYPPEEVGARTVQRIVRGGWMPTQIKDQMQFANPGNPESMEAAGALLKAFDAESPGAINGMIDDQSRMQLEAYNRLTEDFSPERAVEMMQGEHDPSLYNQWTPTEKREALANALSEVADINWSLVELEQNPMLKRQVEREMRYYAGFNMVPEKAAALAVKNIDSKHQIVAGQQFSNASQWGPEAELVVKHALSREGVEGSQIVPIAGEPNFAIIQDEGSMWAGGERVRITDLVTAYDTAKANDLNIAAAHRNERVRMKYQEEAVDRAFPGMARSIVFAPRHPSNIGQPQLDLRDRRQAAWESLTPVEQDAIFTKLAEEDAADKASLEAAKRKAFSTRM